MNVVIVDDNKSVAMTFSKILDHNGIPNTYYTRPLDVLNLNKSIDILITDVCMPLMNGYKLSRKLEKTNKDLFTIFISATIDCHQKEKFNFFSKPLLDKDFLKIFEIINKYKK